MAGKAFFADVLSFNSHDSKDHRAHLLRDALMLVEGGRITALGSAAELESQLPEGVEKIRYI